MTTFRYFLHPHEFSNYQEEPRHCDICGRTQSGYEGPFAGEHDEVEFVCEDCLSSGRLQELDLSTNDGNVSSLRRQLRVLEPQLADVELDRLARERTAAIEHRTPCIMTWQDFFWPTHCGDYCRFIKEVGQPELNQLSPEGNGVAFFAAHASDIEDMDSAREIWEGIRPDAPSDGKDGYTTGVYLFRCLVCGQYVVLWDCD